MKSKEDMLVWELGKTTLLGYVSILILSLGQVYKLGFLQLKDTIILTQQHNATKC